MQLNEQHFIDLVDKQIHAESTEEEDIEIERWVTSNPRAKEIYDSLYALHFKPHVVKAMEHIPKEAAIQQIFHLAEKKQRSKTAKALILTFCILLLITAILFILYYLIS